MIARLAHLRKHPPVFRHLTGLTVPAFGTPSAEVVPAVETAHRKTLDRPDRQRAIGAGGEFGLRTADQFPTAVLWLRQYPTREVLGFLVGVSDSPPRAVRRCLPALEQAGKDTMRVPDLEVGRQNRLPALPADTPGLAVVIDTFEQRAHRPLRRQRAYDSGKMKAHTLKSRVGVDENPGRDGWLAFFLSPPAAESHSPGDPVFRAARRGRATVTPAQVRVPSMTRRSFLTMAAVVTLGMVGAEAAAGPGLVEFTVLARTDRPMVAQPGTRIVLYNQSNRVVARGVTGPTGEVMFRVPPGRYIVEAIKETRAGRLYGVTWSSVGPGPRDRQTVVLR